MHVSLSAQKRNGDGFENEYKATCKIYLFFNKNEWLSSWGITLTMFFFWFISEY